MKKQNCKRILKNIVISLVIPVSIFIIFAILTEGRTATMRMLTTTIRQSVVPIIICWGLMLNFSVGMVNFSAGAMVLFSGIIGGNLALATGTGVLGIFIFCVVVAATLGAITGFLYKAIRVPSMVLTIGTLMIWESAPNIPYPNGVLIPFEMNVLATSPYIYILLALQLVIFYLLFNKTAFGHNLSAIGNNQTIANSVGINSDRIKMLSFVFGGVFLGVAAAVHLSSSGELRNATALSSMMIMMDGFMGVFMAMFLARYCNIAFAVMIGTFSMRMLSNGFIAMGFSATVRDIVQGLLLLTLLTISANAGLLETRRANRVFKETADKEQMKEKPMII